MKFSRRHVSSALGLSGLATSLGLATCADRNSSETFKLGMVEFPGYAPWYLARDKHFFKNTKVELQRIPLIGDIRALFNSGGLDGYVATFDIFQSIEESAPPGKLVLPLVESNGGDGVVVIEGIDSVEDLRGKAVAGERGLPPIFILEYLLNKANLTLADVAFQNVPSDNVPAAFVSGTFAGAGTYQPLLDLAVSQVPGSRILVTSKSTPGLITDFLVTSEKVLEERLPTLVDVAQGWFAALAYFQRSPADAISVMAAAFGIKPDEMHQYGTFVHWMSKDEGFKFVDQSKSVNAYELYTEVGEVLKRNNQNIHLIKASEAIDLRLLNRIRLL